MGKYITIPEDYDIVNNQCGTLSNVSGYDYLGTNITTAQLKTALSESTNSIAYLCSSSNINKWAAFKSGYFGGSTDYLNAVFTWIPSTDGFRLGDFIGYNHNALPPVYYSATIPESISIEEGEYIDFNVNLKRGEAAPVYNGALKTQINVQTIWNSITTNNLNSIPLGGELSQSISILPTNNSTLYIKPYYYLIDDGGEVNLSAIEDGFKEVSISTVPLQFTGTVTDVTDRTGGNPTSPAIRWHIIRSTTTSKSVYCRIYITGTGINTVDYSLGYLTFSGSEDKTGLPFISIESNTGYSTVVTIKVQVDVNSDFSNPVTVAQSSFNWTSPGLPE